MHKIGISCHLANRLKDLQRRSGEKIELLATQSFGDWDAARAAERWALQEIKMRCPGMLIPGKKEYFRDLSHAEQLIAEIMYFDCPNRHPGQNLCIHNPLSEYEVERRMAVLSAARGDWEVGTMVAGKYAWRMMRNGDVVGDKMRQKICGCGKVIGDVFFRLPLDVAGDDAGDGRRGLPRQSEERPGRDVAPGDGGAE